jgi:glycosyltransferase involved in cell wall biosynthesis
LPALLRNNNFQLIISGITQSEEYKQQIIETAQQHGVADRVLFTGSISENDKQWYLQNCTAFVFPSLAEGFGLPVIEAMHFGKPVFLSNLTALPEIGGDAAYYFENFDAAEMQAVLTNGLQHFNNNQQSKIVMERAAMFNWDTIARQYLDVYRSLY